MMDGNTVTDEAPTAPTELAAPTPDVFPLGLNVHTVSPEPVKIAIDSFGHVYGDAKAFGRELANLKRETPEMGMAVPAILVRLDALTDALEQLNAKVDSLSREMVGDTGY